MTGSSKGWSEEIKLGSWNKSNSRMQLMFFSVSVPWQPCSRPDDRSCSSRSVVSGQSQPLLPSKLVLFLRFAFQRVCTASIIICRTYGSCRQID